MKYRPEFPDRFGSIQDARRFCQEFFPWYNTEHHHSGLGLLTPEVVHTQRAEQVRQLRQQTLDVAYAAHPERFVRKPPQPPALPTEVWINPPPKSESASSDSEQENSINYAGRRLKTLDNFRSTLRRALPSVTAVLTLSSGESAAAYFAGTVRRHTISAANPGSTN